MALIKGKQIQSLAANKIVETSDKQFVTVAEKASYAGKAEVAQIESAVSNAKTEIGKKIAAVEETVAEVKDEVAAGGKDYTDGEVAKLTTSINEIDGKVTVNANAIAAGLGERYTKEEVDNRLSQVSAGIKYKGTVASYAEIETKFPNPEQGWLVAVEAANKFYLYSTTHGWEEFPISVSACTTHSKTIALSVTDNQTEIHTGIKTDGQGALQTSVVLAQELTMVVNGYVQTKGIDFTIAIVSDEVVITWLGVDFALEQSDSVAITYNQIV